MTGPGTQELHTVLPPELEAVFRDYGHDLFILWPEPGGGEWGSLPTPPASQQMRGLLMPAGAGTQRAAQGAGLPVPAYEAYLPYDPALSTPGWHIEHDGQFYHPTADARDEGGQGVLLMVPLAAPGQVVGNG